MNYRKFVNWEAIPFERVSEHHVFKAMKAFENGDKEPMKNLHFAEQTALIRTGGWELDLKPYMNTYWVKTMHYGILEVYAMNKTDIRKNFGHCKIIKIVQIED